MAVVPIEKDALEGPALLEIVARLAARVRETDRAIAKVTQIESCTRI